MSQIQYASRLATGCMHNTVHELCIIKRLGVNCQQRRAPKVIEVNWHPPIIDCVKINTDGAWKSSSQKAGCGGVFRDHRGNFMGAYSSNLDIPSSIAAEVMAVIKAIQLAWLRDWKHIWLEVDSKVVLSYFHSPSIVPWQLKVEWENCLHLLSQMQFKVSHIYREGNHVADALANHGTTITGFVWWDSPPLFITHSCQQDWLGMPKFRFVS